MSTQDQRRATGRHPRDAVRLAVSAAVVGVCFLIARLHQVDPTEAGIYRDIARLPSWTETVSRALDQLGSVAAIAVAAGVALFVKQVRLGAKLILGGTIGWVTATLVRVFAPVRTIYLPHGGVPGSPSQLYLHASFPSVRMAVATAMATVASPYLPRSTRRLLPAVVALVAVAEDFTGHHLPLDVLAGAFIGWGLGTLLHLVWGAPGRSTSAEVVGRTLRGAGLDVTSVMQIRSRVFGPRHFEALTTGGDCLLVEVVRRGQRRAGALYKLRRLLASLEVEDEPGLSSPSHEVDHEAFVTLLAERSGVRTPAVILAGQLGHGPALLVRPKLPGRRMHQMGPDELDDGLLDEIWRQVATLGSARIAHHDLRAENVLVDDKHDPWILDFTFARAGANSGRIAQDVAEMLISLTSVVGIERAVASATRCVPERQLRSAVTYLQPLALPARIRQQLKGPALSDLSTEVASRVGETRPSFRPRIRASTVLTLAVGGGAVYLLLPQIGTVPALLKAVKHANYWWLTAAFAAGAMTFPMAAASYVGAVRRPVPFWRTTAIQLASAFTSRLTPGGLGGMGLNMIYLERLGTPRPEAVGSIALNQAAGVVVHATGSFIAAAALGAGGFIGKVKLPTGWPVLVAVVVVLAAAGVFLGSPIGRRRVLQPGWRVTRELVGVLGHPVRALALFGGSAGVTLGNALALVASLAAFSHRFSVLTVIAVYVGGAAIASAAPTPGNLGAVEAALVAGLTGIGIASEPSVAAVLTFRLLTFWLPILPGMAMFRYMQHRRVV